MSFQSRCQGENIRHPFLRFGAIALSVLAAPLVLFAQEPPKPEPARVTTEVRTLNFLFEPRAQAPDDELLEVARLADVNLFVDSTGLTEQASPVRVRALGKSKWYLENLLTDIGVGRRLTWEIQEADRAVLLGPEPDIKELRRLLLAGEGVEVAKPKMDAAAFNVRLAEYLQKEHGWAGDGKAWRRTINVADLPEDLRYEMMVRTQQGALFQSLGGASMYRKEISDEAWKEARLSIGSTRGMIDKDGPGLFLSLSSVLRLLTPLPQPRPEEGR